MNVKSKGTGKAEGLCCQHELRGRTVSFWSPQAGLLNLLEGFKLIENIPEVVRRKEIHSYLSIYSCIVWVLDTRWCLGTIPCFVIRVCSSQCWGNPAVPGSKPCPAPFKALSVYYLAKPECIFPTCWLPLTFSKFTSILSYRNTTSMYSVGCMGISACSTAPLPHLPLGCRCADSAEPLTTYPLCSFLNFTSFTYHLCSSFYSNV